MWQTQLTLEWTLRRMFFFAHGVEDKNISQQKREKNLASEQMFSLLKRVKWSKRLYNGRGIESGDPHELSCKRRRARELTWVHDPDIRERSQVGTRWET